MSGQASIARTRSARRWGAAASLLAGVAACSGSDGGGGTDAAPPYTQVPNLIDWAAVAGVEGGIPTRTACVTLDAIDATGATDVLPAVQAAIDACPANQAVVLPAGTFRLDGSLRMKSHVSLRGAGPSTVVRATDKIEFYAGLGRVNVDVVGGTTRGSTRFSLAEVPPGLTVGSSVILNELDDPAYVHPYGYEEDATAPTHCTYCDEPDGGTRVRGQMVRVTAVDGVEVEFTPALYAGFDLERSPRLNYPQAASPDAPNVLVYSGLEDLTLDPLGDRTVVLFNQAQNCWLAGVEVQIYADSVPAIHGYFAHRIEIRRSTFRGRTPGVEVSAILSQVHTGGWLVEDNAFSAVAQSFLNVGRQSGHVFAYNYIESLTGTTTALFNDHGNHGAHPQYLLFEGNKGFKHHADSIHGSSSHTTLFRNHYQCRQANTTYGAGCVWLDSWNYYYNVVGNVLGTPGMTEWQYESESPAPTDQRMYIFRFGYSGYNPYGAYPLSKSTTIRHGNYDYGRDQVDWDPQIPDPTLPPSLYLDAKPAWFGSLPWPPIGPDVDGYVAGPLPAEYRFHHDGMAPP